MDYTKTHNVLRTLFSFDKKIISIPGSEIKIYNTLFRSDLPSAEFSNKNDESIDENRCFHYPVFSPADRNSKKVILLLHGLNERSWVKYLVWAYYLSHATGSYIILFPISFHINRSPSSWRDPRAMMPFMKDRNAALGDIKMSSFANIALSNRLTEDPTRFFKSGYQTLSDIVKLLTSVKNGEHPVIPATAGFNIFAYSIGAFLAEIIMMSNPSALFSGSKLFIFCGGSVFSNMRGSSKLIMDSLAFDKVYTYYLDDFEDTLKKESQLTDFLRSSQIGLAFRSMIDTERLKTFRENILSRLHDQIHSLSLLRDIVIPGRGVISTLCNSGRKDQVDIWDFPFGYSHENPFPVFDNPLSGRVDYWFEKVFSKAAMFLG